MTTAHRESLAITFPSDLEIKITRSFGAPRALVFKAFTSCEHTSRWLGPRYLAMSECQMDFRVGGRYRYILKAAVGSEYAFRGELREISPPERIVQTFEWEGMPGQISVETMTLEERDSITYLTVISQYASVEDRDGMAQSGMEEGIRDSYDRLGEYLTTLD